MQNWSIPGNEEYVVKGSVLLLQTLAVLSAGVNGVSVLWGIIN